MARSLLLAAIVLFTLTYGASRSASQREGFQSINCGGEAYDDPNTKLIWEADPFTESNNEIIHGKVGQVNSSLKNISTVMTTLRFFPNYLRNIKFCYPLEVSKGMTYLLRASFLYGNYDGINQPPTFVLILNNDEWTNVTTSSTTPTIHELIFVSNETDLNICLALDPNSNQTPFISTLELRLLRLDSTMYTTKGETNAISLGHGLMLWRRVNYGARTKAEIRYPEDQFDRIWEADTTGPSVSKSVDKVSTLYSTYEEKPPAEVMATAITSNDSKGNLSFTYEGLGVVDGLRIEMHVQEVDETARGQTTTPRLFNFVLSHTTIQSYPMKASFGAYAYHVDTNMVKFPSPLQLTFFPNATSPRPPLLNALELFRWTPNPLFTILTFPGDVNTILSIQSYFNLTGYGQGDPCMPKHYTWTWVDCSYDIQPRIIKIDLSNFNLKGTIPSFINDLASLKIVDLSNNMLSGEIPDVNLLKKLEYLDLSNNALTGKLPLSLLSLPQLAKLDVSNNNLCGSPLNFQPSTNYTWKRNCFDNTDRPHDGGPNCISNESCEAFFDRINNTKSIPKGAIAGIIIAAIVVLCGILGLVYWARPGVSNNRRRRRRDQDKGDWTVPKGVRRLTYKEVTKATKSFDRSCEIGEGGFGKVYMAQLEDGKLVAIKRASEMSSQGTNEFHNEITLLSRLHHRHLVRLEGFCDDRDEQILVYEFMSNGNLHHHLLGKHASSLNWYRRLEIALAVARGLEYLHTFADPPVIHRDVKPSNILLDDNMIAKVSDFGISKANPEMDTHLSTRPAGTAGYLDPEYFLRRQLTTASDVYGYGVVLLELITGQLAIDHKRLEDYNLVGWVKPKLVRKGIHAIIDPRLGPNFPAQQYEEVAHLAMDCTAFERVDRPTMQTLASTLEKILSSLVPPPDHLMPLSSPSLSPLIKGKDTNSQSSGGGTQPVCDVDTLEPR